MKIGELSERTGVSTRMLRYYEDQRLLGSTRDSNGWRTYPESAVARVLQIRELLDSGMTTQLVHDVLTCLNKSGAPCTDPKNVEALRQQLRSIEHRIETLTRNREAISGYLNSVDIALEHHV
jgi:DNA-binding transcriptional MerR regulator